MKCTSTPLGNLKKLLFILIGCILITLINSKTYGQAKNYATVKPSSGLIRYAKLLGGELGPGTPTTARADGYVDNPDNAAVGDNTFAVMAAQYVNVLVLGGETEAWLQLKYSSSVLAGKTTYVRFTPPTFEGGDLDLLNIVGELTGLFRKQLIEFEVYSGATAASNGTAVQSVNVNTTIVQDVAGNYYFAVTPNVDYNSLRLKFRNRGNLLGLTLNTVMKMNVYSASTILGENCAPAVFASDGEPAGLNVTLTKLVNSPTNAIDNNLATASQLQAGLIGVGSSISQTIILNGLSTAEDYAKVTLSVPPSILTLDLFNNVTIQAFNGNTAVGDPASVSSLLNLDLLGLFANSKAVPVFFRPGAPFDRIKITMGKVVAVGGNILSGGLNIHEVERTVGKPLLAGITGGLANICGNNVSLSLSNNNSAATYNWYRKNGNSKILLAGASGPAFSETIDQGVYTYYVAAQKAGCTVESDLESVTITVTSIPAVPVATAAPVCSGSTGVFAVSNPVAGQTYNWYTSEASTTPVFTGTTFTTPAPLTADASYFVEGVNGTCLSPSRTKVTVTVNPIPAGAQVSATGVTISSGQTATLNAIAPTPDSTPAWYTLASGGVPVATGSSFTTGALTANTTYYVGTVSSAGCSSTSRVAVTVTITGVTPGLTCSAANSQQNAIEGLLCALCGVTTPTGSTDANPATFTTLNLAVGVGVSVYQRLIFPNAGIATDSIRLDLNLPTGLLDATVLGGITANVMNGSTVVKTYQLNSPLIRLNILGGGRRFNVTLPAGGVYDRIEVRLGGLLTALTNLDIYGAEVIYPKPTVATTGLSICPGSSTTLSATPNGSTALEWFTAAVGGTSLGKVNSITTPVLTATTTYYIEVSKGGCANTERVPVKVTVNPAIVFNTATLSNATLTSVYSKQITAATGGTPGFTYTVAPGTTLPAGLSLSPAGLITGTPTATGKVTFSVIATDSKGCNATAAFDLTVTPALALPAATLNNGIVGTVYTTLPIGEATGGTGPYTYTAAGEPNGLTFNPLTREITGTPTKSGTYTVRVNATDANGNSVAKDYQLIVRDPLVLAAATLNDGTVGLVYPTQKIPAATGGLGPYTYTADPTKLPEGLIFDPLTLEITGTPTKAGPYTFAVTVKDAEGKIATNNYTINVKSALVLPPATLADGNVGIGYTSQPLPAATGGTTPYTYAATSLPPGLTFNNITRVISGTPTQSGLYTVTVTVTDKDLTKATNTYTIRVIGALSLPGMVLADGTLGSTYPVQTLPEVTGGTGPYTYAATNLPAGLSFDNLTRKITGVPTLGGPLTFSVTAKDAANNSTTTNYTITVKVPAPTVNAVTVCAGSPATLSIANPIAGATYNWYAATGNTILITANSYTTPVLTANATYYAEAASGTAVSSRTAVGVTVRPAPALAVVSGGQTISPGQRATLTATADAGNTINWYAVQTGGTPLISGNTFTTPALNTTTTYYVETQNAAGCVSLSRVAVAVTVTTGTGSPACNAANAQQTGIDGICLLCGIQGAENSTDGNPANFTKLTLAVGVGATGYQRLIFQNPGVATDSIRLELETPVGLADVGVLTGITVTVYNNTTAGRSYNLSSSLLNLQLLSGNRFKVTLPAAGVYDRVEVRFGGLASVLSSLNIYGAEVIYPDPTVAAAGKTTCSGSTTTLSATANGGTTLKWFAAANGGTALGTGATFTTPVLTATTTYYIEVSKGTCTNVKRVPVTVTVTPAPTAPVLATVLPVCYGSTASLAVNSPVTGLTYNWYTAATGGTPVFSGPVFTTPALTATTSYFVEAVSPGCGGSIRTQVPVTVNPIVALPQIQASSTTVNAGQTVILNGTSADTNVAFNWYTSPDLTNPIYSGPTYVTPPLTVTTTYYLEAKSLTTGCTSVSRVQVTVNVNNGGSPNPVPCENAVTQTNKVNGVALLAGVFNPQLAIDNDTQTGSSLVMPVGLLGASVYQRLGFASVSSVGDTVKLLLTSPGKLLSLGLLSNIQISTYNGATGNNDVMSLSNNLINLELLSGNSQAVLRFVPQAPFDQVQVLLNSGVAGVLTTLDVNYIQRLLVAPTLVTNNPTTCVNQTATFQIKNPNPALTYRWYDATGVTELGQGVSFTTAALTADTKFQIAATTASGCASYKTTVNVTVTPAPTVPELVSATVNTCSGSDVILAVKDPIVGYTYKWYNAAGTTELAQGITFGITNVTATTIYKLVAINSCNAVSPQATATVNVGTLDIPVITPASVTIQSGTPAVLTATSSSAGAIFKWYDSPGSVVVLSTDARFVVTPPANTGNTPVVHKYYVTAEIPGGCAASARAEVSVTVLPQGADTDVPCEGATVQVRNGVDGVALLSAVFNPERATDTKANTGSSFVMPVGALGASIYQHVGFTTLSNIGDTVRVSISSPGKLLSLAVLPSIELTTYKGLVSNNDMITASNPIINLELMSDNSGAIFTFVPQKQFDGVELRLRSGLAAVLTTLDFNYAQRVLVAPKVLAATAGACVGSAAILSVQNPVAGATYKWYKGTGATSVGGGSTFSTEATLAAGTYDYYVTSGINGCESAKTKVTVTILPAPDAPVAVAGNPATTCPNVSVTLAVTPVAGVSYKWYDAEVNGNLLATNTNAYATATNLVSGVYNFYVEAVNGNSCVSTAARTKITLTVNPTATAADVTVTGADLAFCKDTQATLTASSTGITNPKYTWYSDAALTTVAASTAVFKPVVTVNTTFYVTVSGDNRCENTAANAKVVSIVVNPPAVAADVKVTGAETLFCKGTKALLTASSSTVTNPKFTWYSDAALTTVVSSSAIYEPVVTANTTFYVTVSGDNKCENTAANAKVVTITVNTPATAADIIVKGNEAGFCKGTTAKLTASTTTVTNPVFTWFSDAALTTVVARTAVYEPVVTATTTFYVTISGDNRCQNDQANAKVVTVTVNTPATKADLAVTGNELSFCAGGKATLKATTTTVTNPVFTWYKDAALTDVASSGATFITPILTQTTTYYVTVSGANRCENEKADALPVTIIVNPSSVSTDIDVAGGTAPICAGTKALLTASSKTVNGAQFIWYKDAALTDVAFRGPVFEPVLTVTTTYYVTVSGANRCENAKGDAKIVTLTVNTPAVAADVIVSGADGLFCAGNVVKLTAASTTVTSPVFTWYTDAALTQAIFTGPVLERTVNATTTFYVTVKGANKCDNLTGTGKAVTVTINPAATKADLAVTGNELSLCAGGQATLTAKTTTVTSPVFTWYKDAALTVVAISGPTFLTPVLTQTTTYYVTVSGANKCENEKSEALPVTITVNPTAVSADIDVAGSDAAICSGTKGRLVASSGTVTSPVFIWYKDAALTDVAFRGPIFEPVLTATTTYYVTVSGANKCENGKGAAKIVTLTVNTSAVAADITVTGADLPFCTGAEVKLTATSSTVTSPVFTWYTDAALTQATFTGPVLERTINATTTFYVTVSGANRCENVKGAAKIVTVTVNTPAVAADVVIAGADVSFCAGTVVKLTATSTTVNNPVFTWYTDAALTQAIFTGPVLERTLNETTTYYVAVKGSNKCDNLTGTGKAVTVTVNPLPIVPIVKNGGAGICSGDETLLTIENPQTGVAYEWYSAATGGTLLGKGASLPTGKLSNTTDYYVMAISASGCGSPTGRVKATVTVSPKPLVPSVASAAVNACAGSPAVLTVVNPQSGVTYNWFTVASGGTAIGSGVNFTTPVINDNVTFYVEAATANCISTSRTAVRVSVFSLPEAPTAVTGGSTPSCAGNTAVFTVNSPNAAFTYRWYTTETGGTAVAEGSTFTTPSLSATTTFYVASVNTASGCVSAGRTPVVITVLQKLTAPVVSVQAATATSVTFTWVAVAGATAYEVSIDNGLTWISPSSGTAGTTHLIAGLSPDQQVAIRVRAVGQLACQLSDASSLTSKSDNPLGNQIFVPNTFTPNNDGKNDILYVYGNTIAKMRLRVYNQWGQFLYESLNVQSGWDGTYKGEVQPNGVYVYLLEADFNDGTKTTKKGTITLLR